MDRLLDAIVTRAMRRARKGDMTWLAIGAGAWLVRRARRNRDQAIWSGRVTAGERLLISVSGPGSPGPDGSPEG